MWINLPERRQAIHKWIQKHRLVQHPGKWWLWYSSQHISCLLHITHTYENKREGAKLGVNLPERRQAIHKWTQKQQLLAQHL